MRGEVMPSLIRPGGDLVETTNAQLGIRLGDLEETRGRYYASAHLVGGMGFCTHLYVAWCAPGQFNRRGRWANVGQKRCSAADGSRASLHC